MKKFLIKICAFILCLTVIVGCWMYVGLEKVNKDTDAYLAAHAQKLFRLDTLSSPRIILVGGSNTAFGFDSEMLADSLHCNVQNMGLHASIGLRFTMSQTMKHLRRGDVVVIMPEYEQFFEEYNGSGNILSQAFLYSEPGSWKELNAKQMINVIDGFPSVEFNRWRTKRSEPDTLKWDYSARNINIYGDETAHWKADSVEYDIELTKLGAKPDEGMIADFSSKFREMREKGCKIILLWPSTIKSNYILNKESIDEVSRRLLDEGIIFDCDPVLFLHEDSLKFDSEYHIRYEGVRRNTELLIKLLKRKLSPPIRRLRYNNLIMR